MFRQTALTVSIAIALGTAGGAFASEGRDGRWHSATQGAPSLKVCKKLVASNPQSAIANNDLGWAYRQNGNLAEAEKYLRAALKLDATIAAAHSNLSVVLLDKNAVPEAKAEAQAAVQLDGNNPIYRVVYGNALAKLDDRKGAIEQYRQAVKLKPDYENALYNLGRTLAQDGQVHEAKFVLADALKLDPKDDRVVVALDEITREGDKP